MKPSDALEQGMKRIPRQVRGKFFRWDPMQHTLVAACAIGTMYVGACGLPALNRVAPLFEKLARATDGALDALVANPVTGRISTVNIVVQELSDVSWRREKIMEWLRECGL